MSLWIAIHISAAVFWVGGMIFAYAFVRPAAGALQPAERLTLWRAIFSRFFPLVWLAVIALLGSGYAMVFLEFGGFAGIGMHVHLMQGTGLLMMLLFAHVFFAPWRKLCRALDSGDIPAGAAALNQIRQVVLANSVLGAITVLLGATGRYWG